VYPLELKRIDERTVALRAEAGGFLQPMGRWDVPGQPRDPLFNMNYLTQLMDRIFRSEDRPFTRGETTVTEGMTAEVVELAPGGGVREVRFTFEVPLEDASLRWLKWEGRGFQEFSPPKPGESVEFRALDLLELLRP
jgi:hypothetical protein